MSSQSHYSLHLHAAGDCDGYYSYGSYLMQSMSGSPAKSKLLVRKYGSTQDVMVRHVFNRLQQLQRTTSALEDISLQLAGDQGSWMSPSPEFSEHCEPDSVLHEGSCVKVEKRRWWQGLVSRWLVYKTYTDKSMPTHRCYRDQLIYEIDMYRFLTDVPHMLQSEGFFENVPDGLTTLVFPYLSGNHIPTEPKGILDYMWQALQALKELWDREVIHCNIKQENIIYDEFTNLTLIDFESAVRRHELIDQGKFHKNTRHDEPDHPEYRGNPHYVAPEVLDTQCGRNNFGKTLYGRRRDIYSAGIILAELILGCQHLFHSSNEEGSRSMLRERRVLKDRLSNQSSPLAALQMYGHLEDTEFNREGADLAARMLDWDRFTRIKPEDALVHPFFKQHKPKDGRS